MNEPELEKLKTQAEQGDAEAQFQLARHLDETNAKEAATWYRKAAEQGHAKAQNNLGAYFFLSVKDYSEAFKWYRKAAEQNSAAGQYNLGNCYLFGNGVESDFEKALQWFRSSSASGYKAAENKLEELADAIKMLEAARHGGTDAKFVFGVFLRNDYPPKENEAFKWFLAAAEGGHATAQFEAGECYRLGNGVEKNETEAFKWLGKAAEQGHAKARRLVRKRKDFEKSLRLAEQGDADSRLKVGTFYKKGIGTAKNPVEAFKWVSLAAEQGLPLAQFALGTFYQDGTGVEKDNVKAFKWFKLAAERDIPAAQFRTGMCLKKGTGTEKDLAEAFKWISLAAAQGFREARLELERFYGNGSKKKRKNRVREFFGGETDGVIEDEDDDFDDDEESENQKKNWKNKPFTGGIIVPSVSWPNFDLNDDDDDGKSKKRRKNKKWQIPRI